MVKNTTFCIRRFGTLIMSQEAGYQFETSQNERESILYIHTDIDIDILKNILTFK